MWEEAQFIGWLQQREEIDHYLEHLISYFLGVQSFKSLSLVEANKLNSLPLTLLDKRKIHELQCLAFGAEILYTTTTSVAECNY